MAFAIISVVLLTLVFGILLAHAVISRAVLRQPDWGVGERLAALSASAFLLGTFWLAFGGLYVLLLDTQNPGIGEPWLSILFFVSSPASFVFTRVRGVNFFQCFYAPGGACDPWQFIGPAALSFTILMLISGLIALSLRRKGSGE